MIKLCPYCGFKLKPPLRDGIKGCDNCLRVFDCSCYHKLLSASWLYKNWHIDICTIREQCELNDCETALVEKYVVDRGFTHDDLLKVFKKLGG